MPRSPSRGFGRQPPASGIPAQQDGIMIPIPIRPSLRLAARSPDHRSAVAAAPRNARGRTTTEPGSEVGPGAPAPPPREPNPAAVQAAPAAPATRRGPSPAAPRPIPPNGDRAGAPPTSDDSPRRATPAAGGALPDRISSTEPRVALGNPSSGTPARRPAAGTTARQNYISRSRSQDPKMMTAHRIRLSVTPAQARTLTRWCEAARRAWNWALEERDRQHRDRNGGRAFRRHRGKWSPAGLEWPPRPRGPPRGPRPPHHPRPPRRAALVEDGAAGPRLPERVPDPRQGLETLPRRHRAPPRPEAPRDVVRTVQPGRPARRPPDPPAQARLGPPRGTPPLARPRQNRPRQLRRRRLARLSQPRLGPPAPAGAGPDRRRRRRPEDARRRRLRRRRARRPPPRPAGPRRHAPAPAPRRPSRHAQGPRLRQPPEGRHPPGARSTGASPPSAATLSRRSRRRSRAPSRPPGSGTSASAACSATAGWRARSPTPPCPASRCASAPRSPRPADAPSRRRGTTRAPARAPPAGRGPARSPPTSPGCASAAGPASTAAPATTATSTRHGTSTPPAGRVPRTRRAAPSP